MPLISGTQRNRGRPRPSQSHAQQNRRAAQLPEYEPPSFPLDAASRRALAELSNNTDTRIYEEQLKQSITLLTNNVRDINDRYVTRKDNLGKLKKQQRGQNDDDDGGEDESRKRQRAEEAAVMRLREEVPTLTAECESAMRDVIDLRIELEDGRGAIQDTVRKAEVESENAANREQEDGEVGAKNEDEDLVMGDAQRGILGPLRILKNEREKAAADYATRSMEQRYAVDNDYIGFKRLWWDAVHSKDGKPLPDASRWFAHNNAGGDEEEDEEEEDLVIAEEHLSIYCPLSMVVMEQPYTSSVCKHTFNKPAIVQYLREQPGHRATCPQTGCSKEISIKDFYDDQVMLRKIQRTQAESQKREPDDEDEDDEGDGDSSMLQQSGVKAERARDRGNQLLADLGLDPEEDAV